LVEKRVGRRAANEKKKVIYGEASQLERFECEASLVAFPF
jgi:hypothetical protein